MTIRKIATIGHPVLRKVAAKLTRDELALPETQRFIDDLVETMFDANGAGLAANQIFEPLQICAICVKDNPRYPYKPNYPLTVLVNPELTPVYELRRLSLRAKPARRSYALRDTARARVGSRRLRSRF
jgi:peptide deformylase